ncbi:MAG: DUF7557 family protein [Methanomicrobiales archaeon]
MAVTTIQVAPDVKARLEGLKRYAQESYNDVIIRLLDLALDTTIVLPVNVRRDPGHSSFIDDRYL